MHEHFEKFPLHQVSVDIDLQTKPIPRRVSGLWIQGSDPSLLLRLPQHGLAVVGTRNPHERTLRHVENVISQARGSKLVILSGFARGVDACAHRAALGSGLPTVAFLASGHRIAYPLENAALREEILESGGLLVSEYPPDRPAHRGQFLERNGLMVYFSHAVWVAEAPYRSGAMNSASHAVHLGKRLLATPAFPTDSSYLGNLRLLHQDHYAAPMIDAKSLGAAWSDFQASPRVLESCSQIRADLPPEVQALVQRVRSMLEGHPEAPLDALLSDWLDGGRMPGDFYVALERAVQSRVLRRTERGSISLA